MNQRVMKNNGAPMVIEENSLQCPCTCLSTIQENTAAAHQPIEIGSRWMLR